MTKNLYLAKLKNLSDQINIMLMEAQGGLQEAGHAMGMSKMEKILESLKASGRVTKDEIDGLLQLWEEGQQNEGGLKLFSNRLRVLLKKSREAAPNVSSSTWKSITDFLMNNKKSSISVGIGLIVLASSAVFSTISRALSVNNVKDLTNKAINAQSYKETLKYINALKKVATNDSLWSKITTSQAARNLAATNAEAFKKSYITVGSALCIASVIACIIFGVSVDTFGPLIESIKKLDFKGILVSLGKLVALTALAIPGLIGVCFIIIGLKGFPEQGIAADILEALAPVVQLANQAVKSILELAQEAAAQGGQAQPARITRTTKKVK